MVKKILLGVVGFLLSTILLGFGLNTVFQVVVPRLLGIYEGSMINYALLFRLDTYLYGAVCTILIALLVILFARPSSKKAKKRMKSKVENFESNLENSRFMTDKERDFNFNPYQFTKLKESIADE